MKIFKSYEELLMSFLAKGAKVDEHHLAQMKILDTEHPLEYDSNGFISAINLPANLDAIRIEKKPKESQ